MRHLIRDFISEETRHYKFKLGELVASALTGFIVGVVVASIVWMLAFYYINNVLLGFVDVPALGRRASGWEENRMEDATADTGSGQQIVARPSKVRVISPNGGEVWERRQDYNVRWDFKDLPLNTPMSAVLIRTNSVITNPYAKNGRGISSREMFYPAMFPQGYPKDGSYTYRVPDTLTPGSYQVAIYAGENCTALASKCEYDLSNKLFTIK